MKKLPLILFILVAIGCSKQSNQSSAGQSLINQLMADNDPEGLPYWTADTIKKTNPELVLLMDTLYRYVRSETYPSINLADKRSWMDNYRKQLVAYYDRNHLGPDTVSLLDKANAVILAADSLWTTDNDYSTMGMLVNRGTEYTRREFQEFNEFERLFFHSNSPEYKKACEEEFIAWQGLQKEIVEIVSGLNNILNYGGSIIGLNISSAYLNILEAHVDLYKKDYGIFTYSLDTSIDYGVFPEGGRDLLSFCVNDLIKESYDYLNIYEPKDQEFLKSDYETLLNAYKNLPEVADKWMQTREKVIGFATDYQSREMNLNTGQMLVRLSSVISSIQ